MKSYGVTIQMKATELYFPVVLFIMLYKVILTFESENQIQWCDHANESYWTVLSQSSIKFDAFFFTFAGLFKPYAFFKKWLFVCFAQ